VPTADRRPTHSLSTRTFAFRLSLAVVGVTALATLALCLVFDTWEQRSQFGDTFGFLGALWTALGLVAVWIALRVEQQTSLENELNREFRELIPTIELRAWTSAAADLQLSREAGLRLADDDPTVRDAYRYFDLCNTQAQFRRHLSDETWRNWEEGIVENLCRQWFLERFEKITAMCQAGPSPAARPGTAHFQSLQPLVDKAKARLAKPRQGA